MSTDVGLCPQGSTLSDHRGAGFPCSGRRHREALEICTRAPGCLQAVVLMLHEGPRHCAPGDGDALHPDAGPWCSCRERHEMLRLQSQAGRE